MKAVTESPTSARCSCVSPSTPGRQFHIRRKLADIFDAALNLGLIMRRHIAGSVAKGFPGEGNDKGAGGVERVKRREKCRPTP